MDDMTIIPPNSSGSLDEPRAVAVREPTRVANPITSIRLTTIADILQFADHAAASLLVPENYRGKPNDIVIAVMQGAELGLPPIQALNSIAVINGRPSVWGDAVPGLCYASGKVEDIEEHFTGSPGQDDYTAVCIARRKGVPSPKVGKFSQHDAKVAGLFGKATHSKYPARMMMWRARHFALHDAFPDVLRGIGTRELDAEDMEANAGPRWSKPMPEQQSEQPKPGVQADGWDNTWFLGVGMKLQAEPNAWNWTKLLIAALKDAPTKRDLDELSDRSDVQNTLANAPQEARDKIVLAFNQAMERFKGAKQPAAETTKPKPDAEMEAVIVDQFGEIHGDYSDPEEFASDFVDLYMQADEAARAALLEHNEDALNDARNASVDAASILKTIEAKERPEPKAEEVEDPISPPIVSGKPSWPGYVKALKEAMATLNAGRFSAWADVQRPVLEKCPTAQRALAIKAISENAGRLSQPQPAWLGDLVKPRAATPEPTPAPTQRPAQPDAEAAYSPGGAAKAQPALSVDERWVEETIGELSKVKTQAGFDELMSSTALRTRMSRLRRENEPLFNRADEAFAAKMTEVKGK